MDLGPIKKLKNSFNLHIIVKKIQPRTQWLQCITAIPVSPPCITADRLIHHQMYGFSFNAFAKVSQSQLSTNYLQTFLPLTLTFNFNSILIMLSFRGNDTYRQEFCTTHILKTNFYKIQAKHVLKCQTKNRPFTK